MGRSPGNSPIRKQQTRPFVFAILFATFFVGSAEPILAALTCGPKPDIEPAASAGQVEDDTRTKANLILQARPATSLRSFISVQRAELRQKHAEVEPSVVDGYLMWITCQTISNDNTLTGGQKFDKYADFYRLLSEPSKVPAHAE